MKISEILIEQGPQAPVKPTGSTIAPVKRKTPLNPFAGDEQLQNMAKDMGEKADAAYKDRQQGGEFTQDAGSPEVFQRAVSDTIRSGTPASNLEQSGRNYAKDLKKELNQAASRASSRLTASNAHSEKK